MSTEKIIEQIQKDAEKETKEIQLFAEKQKKTIIIKGKTYEDIVSKYAEEGIKKLGKDCNVLISRYEDKKIIEKLGLKSSGNIEASGGIRLVSKDGKIILDYTFDGILKRDKDKIRNKVGKLLFSK